MHPEILDIIVSNAFNGMGDSIGNDDFGVSIAWIDLNDFLEDYNNPSRDSDDISREAIAYAGGNRYALAYIWQSGNREILAFEDLESMMEIYRKWETEWISWNDENREDD